MKKYLDIQFHTRLPRFLVDLMITSIMAGLALIALWILRITQAPSVITLLDLPVQTFSGRVISLQSLLSLLVILWFAASLLANLITQTMDIVSERPRTAK